jgi:hypothetical protein
MVEYTHKFCAAVCCFSIVFLTGIILFGVSFSVVDVDQYGIVYDHNWQTLGAVKSAGRYLLGVGKSFVLFPRGVILVNFGNHSDAQSNATSCWTNDGLNVYIECSFYYTLNPNLLVPFYQNYGDNWYASVVRMTISQLKETATQFSVNDYFQNRLTVSEAMSQAINNTFSTFFQNATVLFNFQLLKITFDPAFEQTITQKLIWSQYQNTVIIQQTLSTILKQIELIQNQGQNNISMILGNATAFANYQMAVAQSNAMTARMAQYATAYGWLFNNITAIQSPTNQLNDTLKLQLLWASELPYMNNVDNYYIGMNNVLIS